MSEEIQHDDSLNVDKRSAFRRLLTGAFAAILLIAVPIARSAGCSGGSETYENIREIAYTNKGEYVGSTPPAWVSMSEGLRYLPESVMLSLKRPGTKTLSLSSEYLFERPERFGLVKDPAGGLLPLGLAVDRRDTERGLVPMVGLTCGACHVGAIAKEGKWMLVPGAPNYMSVNVFFGDMIGSLAGTLANPVAFDELWQAHAKNLGIEVTQDKTVVTLTPESATAIVNGKYLIDSRVSSLPDAYPSKVELNTRAKLAAYLSARLVQLVSKAKAGSNSGTGGPLGTSNPWSTTRALLGSQYVHSEEKFESVGGPITAPDIFNYGERKYVFWAQATNSMMERNLAQGLALLGDVDWNTMETSVSPGLLSELERQNEWIEAPAWPTQLLGEVNQILIGKGCKTFKTKCASCHEYEHTEGKRGSLNFNVYDVGTDSTYCSGVNSSVEGYKSVPELVAPVAAAVKKQSVAADGIESLDETGRFPVEWKSMKCNELPARSLEGSWATAPYLHNGSVASMEDLLKPLKERSINFYVGAIEYDAQKLGFTSVQAPFTTLVNTVLPGLSNKGHEFIVEESDRAALLEYLKVHRDGDVCE